MRISLLMSLALSAISLTFARPITSLEIAAKSGQGLRLVSLEEGTDPVWKTEADIFALIKAKKHFVRRVYL